MTAYYEADGITIYHGDCREILPSITADVLVTDPPYGIGFASRQGAGGSAWRTRRREVKPAESWDHAVIPEVTAIAARFPEAFVWGGNYYSLPPSRGWLCWIKPDSPPSMGSFEMCWTSRDAVARHIIEPHVASDARTGHPTQKPLRVMTFTLSFASPGVIMDPFMGSGTTLVAAKNLGRKAIGIELEERYCEIAARRMAQRTLDLGGAA